MHINRNMRSVGVQMKQNQNFFRSAKLVMHVAEAISILLQLQPKATPSQSLLVYL